MTTTTAIADEITTTIDRRVIGFAQKYTGRTVTYTAGTFTMTLLATAEDEPIRKLCFSCEGSGFLREYAHVHDGLCYRCNGAGTGAKYNSVKNAIAAVNRAYRKHLAAVAAAKRDATIARHARIVEDARFAEWTDTNAALIAKITQHAEHNHYLADIVHDLKAKHIPDTHQLARIDQIIAERDAACAKGAHHGTAKARITLTATVTAANCYEVERKNYYDSGLFYAITLTDSEGDEYLLKGDSAATRALIDAEGQTVTVKGTIFHSSYRGADQTILKRPVLL